MNEQSGRLTTHVLDTANGVPASGMRYRLYRVGNAGNSAERQFLSGGQTNEDGRIGAPLLQDANMAVGCYELEFDVATYFSSRGAALSEPPFLDVVVLRFGISNAVGHYHVPLLVSPWSYSTYRGS